MKWIKQRLHTFAGIAALLSFFALLGIVGAVERGAPLEQILTAIPALAAFGIFSFLA